MCQFNRGHMSSDMCGHMVGHLWEKIQHKFQIDEQGLYYNLRLEIEINKRKAYSDSRKNNMSGRNQHSNDDGHMGGHMSSHMGGHMGGQKKTIHTIVINNIEDSSSNIKKDSSNLNSTEVELKNQFDEFRKKYPGTKRGLETEYTPFKKKYRNYKELIPILLTSLQTQIDEREKIGKSGAFVPFWKNLKTYLNQQGWEERLSEENKNYKQQPINPCKPGPARQMSDILEGVGEIHNKLNPEGNIAESPVDIYNRLTGKQ